MYVDVTVGRPTNKSAGVGSKKKDMIVFFDPYDVLTWPDRDSKGVLITDDIVMKPGKYMIQVYGTITTQNRGSNTEGDPDQTGVMHNFAFSHPGDDLEIEEFKQNWLNRDICIISEKCGSTRKRLFGEPCNPLRMQVESVDNNESNTGAFTFASIQKGDKVPAVYEGQISLADVKGTFAADDATPSVAAGPGEYQLQSGSASVVPITALDDPADGELYTLLGSGGTYPPTISAGGNFLLKNGTTWSAISGARITFKVFKDGASSFKFIEQFRA